MAEQKAKVVHGPGPRGMGGPRPKVENPGKLLKRIMAEVFQHYLPHCILVLICIVVSALANVQASLFLQTLIDDYIIPMTQQQDPSFAPLAGALVRVGCIYVVGILAAWLNARLGKHERVSAVEVRASLPKTMIGKLDRKALRAEATQ